MKLWILLAGIFVAGAVTGVAGIFLWFVWYFNRYRP